MPARAAAALLIVLGVALLVFWWLLDKAGTGSGIALVVAMVAPLAWRIANAPNDPHYRTTTTTTTRR